LVEALDCWLAAGAALALCRLEALALRALVLRPLDELPRVLRLPDAFALRLLLPLARALEPLLRALALRLLPLFRALALRLLPLFRALALRLLPLLRVLPLLRLLPLLDPFAFWFRVRPRVDACRVLPPLGLFDEPRLLERLEEPRPLVADILHLLLSTPTFDDSAGAGLPGSYPANRARTTLSGRMFDALQRVLFDV
jgi:hypothetical protein